MRWLRLVGINFIASQDELDLAFQPFIFWAYCQQLLLSVHCCLLLDCLLVNRRPISYLLQLLNLLENSFACIDIHASSEKSLNIIGISEFLKWVLACLKLILQISYKFIICLLPHLLTFLLSKCWFIESQANSRQQLLLLLLVFWEFTYAVIEGILIDFVLLQRKILSLLAVLHRPCKQIFRLWLQLFIRF